MTRAADTELAIRRLEEWTSLEPVHRGFEITLGVREASRQWMVDIWSLRGAVSRWGIVKGFGSTAEEARADAFRRRWDRYHRDGEPFVDECINREENPPDIMVSTKDLT